MTPNEVKVLAQNKNIPILQPARIRDNGEFLESIKQYNADYFIVVAYGKILPKELLEIANKAPINIHGSLLPKYRGASPIQAALIAWERETGITVMVMNEKMDEGDIIDIKKIGISERETTATLFEKFAELSGNFTIETLLKLEKWQLIPQTQDSNSATYCKKIIKEEWCLDFRKSAKELYHLYQWLTPWPGIYTHFQGKKLIIEQCFYDEITTENKIIGTVIQSADKTIGIICGEWILTLSQVKLEWKKSQSIQEFLNGQREFIGTELL